MLLRRGALLFFFNVIRQISRSPGSKNPRFWPKSGVSGLYLHFEFTDGYEMMHKAWNNIKKLPYCFRGHPSNFKVTQDKKLQILTQMSIISRSHGLKQRRFESNFSRITWPVSVIKFLRFALFWALCIFFEWALSMHTSMNRYSLFF